MRTITLRTWAPCRPMYEHPAASYRPMFVKLNPVNRRSVSYINWEKITCKGALMIYYYYGDTPSKVVKKNKAVWQFSQYFGALVWTSKANGTKTISEIVSNNNKIFLLTLHGHRGWQKRPEIGVVVIRYCISPTSAQVPFFYSLTLTFIFKVKVLTFFLCCEYLVNGGRWADITIAIR